MHELEYSASLFDRLFFVEERMESFTTTFGDGAQVEVGKFGYESVIGVSALCPMASLAYALPWWTEVRQQLIARRSSRNRRPMHFGRPTTLVQLRTNLLPATRAFMEKPLGSI